ncbi:MAG: carboxypeptidase regulatory-like domain-containing protein [Pyrinomonadaceae bacterium]
MKVLQDVRVMRVTLFLMLFLIASAGSASAATIAGFVYDQSRTPLAELDVELLNENYLMRDRTRTNGFGRYEFNNITDGRYYIRVHAFRLDYEDQDQMVEVQTVSLLGSTNGYFPQDFYLKKKSGGLSDTVTGVVFAQEVPKEAEDYFKAALKNSADKQDDKAMENLQKALEIAPTYYYALMSVGRLLVAKRDYQTAFTAFMEAASVNPKSSQAFYYAGVALEKLGEKYFDASLASLRKAEFLAPRSPQVAYMLGKLLRAKGEFAEAEKSLVKAKSLTEVKIPEIHIELAQLYANDLKQYNKAADELELYLKASKAKDKGIEDQIASLREKAKSAGQ